MSSIVAILIILIALYLIFCYIKDIKLSDKKVTIILTSIVVLITFLCLRLDIPNNFDIYIYKEQINYFSSLNFLNSIKAIFSETNFLWVLLLRLVGLLSNNCKLLYLITIPGTILPFMYILFSLKKKYSISNRQLIICIFFFFAIISAEHLISGIRNSLAISLFSLGMYKDLFNKNRKGYIFYLISFFIHPMIIIPLFFRIMLGLLKNKLNNIRLFTILLLFSEVYSYIAYYLLKFGYSLIPNKFLFLFYTKLETELNQKLALDYRILIFDLLQIITLAIIMYINIKRKKDIDNKYFLYYYISIFVIGSFGMYNFFIRTRFILAFFIPFLFRKTDKKEKLMTNLEHALLAISICINIYYYYFMYCNAAFI